MTILVTRPSPAAEQLVARLRERGKTAWSLPLIEFSAGRQLTELPARLAMLRENDLVFMLSQQAIHYASPFLQQYGLSWPTSLNYYTPGRGTASAFHHLSGLAARYSDEGESSEMLLRLPELQRLQGRQALILRGNGGRELLGNVLLQRGAHVHYLECYQRRARQMNTLMESRYWRERGINTLVVTSGGMLQQLCSLFSPADCKAWLMQCHLIVVSERLAMLARQAGWQTITVADGADNDALLRTLQNI